MTLMERLLAAGYPRNQIFHHESDLYVFVTPTTTKIIEQWCSENGYIRTWNCPTFFDTMSGRLMFDCAFQYDDYWNEKLNI